MDICLYGKNTLKFLFFKHYLKAWSYIQHLVY